jgi:hypothetical protein
MDPSRPSSKKVPLPVGKALAWSLLLCVIVGGVGTLIAFEPDFRGTPVLGLVTVWTLSLAIGVGGFWNARRPSWIAVFVVLFSLTTLFLASAIHALGPYFSGWLWIALLALAYLLAWIQPLLDSRLAKALSDEQLRPRTRLGRNIPLLLLVLAVAAVLVIGVFHYRHAGPVRPVMLFIGAVSALLAVGTGQTFSYQVRQKWERENLARQDDRHSDESRIPS